MKGYVKKTGSVQQNNDVQDYKNGTPFDVQKHPKGQKNSRAFFHIAHAFVPNPLQFLFAIKAFWLR